MPFTDEEIKYLPQIRYTLQRQLTMKIRAYFPMQKSTQAEHVSVQETCSLILTEGHLIAKSFQLYIATLSTKRLNKTQIDAALANFGTIPIIETMLNQYVEHIATKKTEALSFELSDTELVSAISTWCSLHHDLMDERKELHQDKSIRRRDSLARLLSLQDSLSVCTSIAIEEIDGRSTLLIACNLSKNNLQEEVCTKIHEKVTAIRRSVLSHPVRTTIDALVHALQSISPLSLEFKVMQQAAKKIINEFSLKERGAFTEAQKQAISTLPYHIIVAEIREHRPHLLVRMVSDDGFKDTIIPMEFTSKVSGVKFMHAEQLLTYYVRRILRQTSPLALGISKLCCNTCFDQLEEENTLVRGYHGQSYCGVLPLLAPEKTAVPKTPSTRPAITHAAMSAENTPERKTPTRHSPAMFAKTSTPTTEALGRATPPLGASPSRPLPHLKGSPSRISVITKPIAITEPTAAPIHTGEAIGMRQRRILPPLFPSVLQSQAPIASLLDPTVHHEAQPSLTATTSLEDKTPAQDSLMMLFK